MHPCKHAVFADTCSCVSVPLEGGERGQRRAAERTSVTAKTVTDSATSGAKSHKLGVNSWKCARRQLVEPDARGIRLRRAFSRSCS